jgi:hypothetical protein
MLGLKCYLNRFSIYLIVIQLMIGCYECNSETVVNSKTDSDMSLYIDEKQVKQFFSGISTIN